MNAAVLTTSQEIPTLADAVAQSRVLPPLPDVVLELLRAMDQDDVDQRRLARQISSDVALASRTLRIANSPFYGMSRQVATIADALSVLGTRSLRMLVVTAAAAGGGTTPMAPGRLGYMSLWRHCLATALCARTLAERFEVEPELAFVTGLVHDVGQFALLKNFPSHWARVARHVEEKNCSAADAEAVVLGFDHAQLGAALARHWRLMPEMETAIAMHHADPDGQPPLVRVVSLANRLSHIPRLAAEQGAQAAGEEDGALEDEYRSEVEQAGRELAEILRLTSA